MDTETVLRNLEHYVYDHDLKKVPVFIQAIEALKKKNAEEKEIQTMIRDAENKAYQRGYFNGIHGVGE